MDTDQDEDNFWKKKKENVTINLNEIYPSFNDKIQYS